LETYTSLTHARECHYEQVLCENGFQRKVQVNVVFLVSVNDLASYSINKVDGHFIWSRLSELDEEVGVKILVDKTCIGESSWLDMICVTSLVDGF